MWSRRRFLGALGAALAALGVGKGAEGLLEGLGARVAWDPAREGRERTAHVWAEGEIYHYNCRCVLLVPISEAEACRIIDAHS